MEYAEFIDTQMSEKVNRHYKLATGSKVRKEDFGLLFYTKNGPRLFFVSSGDLIGCEFFDGEMILNECIKTRRLGPVPQKLVNDLAQELDRLCERGVLLGF